MRATICSIVLVLFCPTVLPNVVWAQQVVDYSPYIKKEYIKNGYTLPYRILFPNNMKEGVRYPLFVFLHGIGLGGKDNERQLQRGADLFLKPENRTKYPSIVVYPQAPLAKAFVTITRNGKPSFLVATRKMSRKKANLNEIDVALSPYGEMVYDVIKELITDNVVDTSRIYIGGVSMGAYTTYQLIAEYPDLFAAAVVLSGGASLANIDKWAGKVPLWIVHGEKDPMVPVENSRLVVDELKKRNITNFRYSEHEGIRHHSWDVAFEDSGFLEWIFSKRKQ